MHGRRARNRHAALFTCASVNKNAHQPDDILFFRSVQVHGVTGPASRKFMYIRLHMLLCDYLSRFICVGISVRSQSARISTVQIITDMMSVSFMTDFAHTDEHVSMCSDLRNPVWIHSQRPLLMNHES